MINPDGIEEGSACCRCGKDLGSPVWYRRECGGHGDALKKLMIALAGWVLGRKSA